MEKVLIIEDDYDIRSSIVKSLEAEGYLTFAFRDGNDALECLDKQAIDIILLDVMLPTIQGEEILKIIRFKSMIPIIIISALSDEFVQYDAYEYQIDDYIVKPFSMNLLIYKIKAIMRRIKSKGSHSNIIEYGHLKLFVDSYKVTHNLDYISLTTKEFEILQLLLSYQGHVLSRDEILTLVWGYDYFGDARNIDVHIKNLRKKLSTDLIQTVKGVGYMIKPLER